MTAVAEETLSDAGFDWSELNSEKTEAVPGPLTGSRGTTSGTGQKRGRRSAKSKLEGLQKRLSGEMFQAGAMIGIGLHTTGYYICQESDTFTKAVVQLAANRPEWVEALEHLADIQPGIMIGRTLVGVGAAVAVDRGRANPEKQFMKFLGVYTAWRQVNESGEGLAEGSRYTEPPATFAPVA